MPLSFSLCLPMSFILVDFQWLSYEGLWRTISKPKTLYLWTLWIYFRKHSPLSTRSRLCRFVAPHAKHLGLLKSWILRSPILATFNMRLYTCQEWKARSTSKSRRSYLCKCLGVALLFNHFWSFVAMPRPNQKLNDSLTAALHSLRKQQELQLVLGESYWRNR